MIKFYWYPKCSTCQKAKKVLIQQGTNFEEIDITKNPPSVDFLKTIVKSGQYSLKQLFNTSGEIYRELKLRDRISTIPEDQLFKFFNQNGKLIKRPIISDGKSHVVGLDEQKMGFFA